MAKKADKALQKALDVLDEQGARRPGRRKTERFLTGLVRLDESIGGGIVKGRIYEIAGNETAGKTTLALEVVKAIQAQGSAAVYLDFEHALDPAYAARIGVGISEDKFVFDQPETLQDGLLVGLELIGSGAVGVVVIDSVAAMVPESELEDSKAPAQQARAFGPELRKYIGVLSKTGTAALFVNQVRASFKKWEKFTTPGGKGLKYFASVRLFLSAGKSKVYDDGIRTKISVWKNKTSVDQRGKSEYEIRPIAGIVRSEEILDIAKKKGLVSERAGIFTAGSRKIRGRETMLKYLEDERLREWVLTK